MSCIVGTSWIRVETDCIEVLDLEWSTARYDGHVSIRVFMSCVVEIPGNHVETDCIEVPALEWSTARYSPPPDLGRGSLPRRGRDAAVGGRDLWNGFARDRFTSLMSSPIRMRTVLRI